MCGRDAYADSEGCCKLKISVIVPTYGEPRYLENTIRSVQNQTYQNWELIIVDDNNPETGARKATESLVKRFMTEDERIQYIKHAFNRNGAAARNTGIAHAHGEFIAFLDSDDEYMPRRLEICSKHLEKCDASIAGVYTGCEFRRYGKTYNVYNDVKSGNFLTETLACTFMFCTGSNIFVRKSVLDELNGFDESFLRHQDYEFLARLFEKYDLKAISDVLVIKNNENLNVPKMNKIIQIKKQYLEKFKPLISTLSEAQKKQIYQSHYLAIAESGMREKAYKAASIYYKKAKTYGRLSIKTQVRKAGFYINNMLHR